MKPFLFFFKFSGSSIISFANRCEIWLLGTQKNPENAKNAFISLFPHLCPVCVATQWAQIDRYAEIGKYPLFFLFFHFYLVPSIQISHLLAKLIMLDPENLKKKEEKVSKTEARAYFRICAQCVATQWAQIDRYGGIGKYPLFLVLSFLFGSQYPNFTPISEANYARPREFKKKEEKVSKTEARAYFRICAQCV